MMLSLLYLDARYLDACLMYIFRCYVVDVCSVSVCLYVCLFVLMFCDKRGEGGGGLFVYVCISGNPYFRAPL